MLARNRFKLTVSDAAVLWEMHPAALVKTTSFGHMRTHTWVRTSLRPSTVFPHKSTPSPCEAYAVASGQCTELPAANPPCELLD